MLSSLKRVKNGRAERAVEVLNTKERLLSPWQIIALCSVENVLRIYGRSLRFWENRHGKKFPASWRFQLIIHHLIAHLILEQVFDTLIKRAQCNLDFWVCVCVWYQCDASSITQTGQSAYLSLTLRSIFLLILNPFAVSLTSTPHIKHKLHIPPVNERVCVQSSQGHRMGVADLPESTIYTSYR